MTFAKMDATDTNDGLPVGTTRNLAHTLYYVLTSVATGSVSLLVEQIEDDNGYEAFRRLSHRYLKTRRQTTIMQLVKPVNTKFHDDKLETEFTQFELDIAKFESALGA